MNRFRLSIRLGGMKGHWRGGLSVTSAQQEQMWVNGSSWFVDIGKGPSNHMYYGDMLSTTDESWKRMHQ